MNVYPYFFRTAAYWKNGKVIPIQGANIKGTASSTVFKKIAVVGSDVYICGGTYAPLPLANNFTTKYWKNGIEMQLTNQTSVGDLTDIEVSGSDVYVLGNDNGISTYWKNGVAFPLQNGTAKATAIGIDGSDVYICGAGPGGTGVLWKNGVYSVIDATNNFIFPSDMIVLNGDVFISGVESAGSISTPVYVARVMKNGTKIQMPEIILGNTFMPRTDIIPLAVVNSSAFVAVNNTIYNNGVALPPPVHRNLFIRFLGIKVNIY